MKIVVDGHVLDGPAQGTTTYIRGLYANWPKSSDVVIYCDDPDVVSQKYRFDSNVQLKKYAFRGRLLRLFLELPRVCIREKADWLHVQYIAPFFVPCRLVVTTHDILFVDFPNYFPRLGSLIKRALYFTSARRADLVTTVSLYSRERIFKTFRLKKAPFITPNHAINEDNMAPSKLPSFEGHCFGLCVSRLEPRKNQALLVKAFSEYAVKDSTVRLVFVGSQTMDYPDLGSTLASLPLSVRIRIDFLQPTDQELLWLYQNCKFFCYPSHCEGFGIPILEAYHAGCRRIICARNTALSELGDYVDYYFDSNDGTTLASLVSDSFMSSSNLTKKGRALSDWSETSALFEQELSRLISAKNTQR